MSILEILEAHYDAAWNYQGRRECACGHEFTAGYSAPIHRAHVAQVLEQHEREAKSEVLTDAAAESERLCRIGDTPQSQVTDEETQEFWIWHAKTTGEWLRDRAAQLKETP